MCNCGVARIFRLCIDPRSRISMNIFDFVDYRVFLDLAYKEQKTLNPSFSHRFIASRMGAGSAGWFADLVKGRINLSGNHMVALAKLFGLGSAEREYFEALVLFDQAGSTDEKNVRYRKLLSLKGVKPDLVGQDRFEFYSEWHHAVIRELLFFHDFRGNYAALAKKLQPTIGIQDAKRSIRLLESLGFIRKTAGGGFKPTQATLKKDPAFKALNFANYVKANIDLGAESLESFTKDERDISTMTLSLSAGAYQRAKEEIRALRERLLALTETDESPERVYQFNFHAFPVTRSE